jgi:hypothetical protein
MKQLITLVALLVFNSGAAAEVTGPSIACRRDAFAKHSRMAVVSST